MKENIIVNKDRVHNYNDLEYRGGLVIYWMSRDQRVEDNWAFLYALSKSEERNCAFAVVFCLVDEFLNAAQRQYDFMLKGLSEVDEKLRRMNIPFVILKGYPEIVLPKFISINNIGLVVSDFDPLKIKQEWKQKLKSTLNIPFHEVDAHNIVPCRIASNKKEFSARTIRTKINSKLMSYLTEFPDITELKLKINNLDNFKWEKTDADFTKYSGSPTKVNWLEAGSNHAQKILNIFIEKKADDYTENRNQPAFDALSNLSPYLHFGQISAQRVVLEVTKSNINQKSRDSFLEEITVRRELSDNFCFYEKNYDDFDGFHDWAKQTLSEHRGDHRDHLYSLETLENAETHDDLWNAAQKEMLLTGKMHGYMRMYWAKKMLEWTQSPEVAIDYAIYLNDRYELDGRDPNGYTGIAWSIGGIHDRPWQERNIFGKIRYMSYNSQIKKVKLKEYIERVNTLEI